MTILKEIIWENIFPASKVESPLRESHRDHKPHRRGNADKCYKHVWSGWFLYRIMFVCFFPWCLVLHITLCWHPSVYSNSCDWDLIFTSVNGFKKTFSSQFSVGLETIIKTSAVMRLLVPEDVPSRCSVCLFCVVICCSAVSPLLHQWMLVSEIQVTVRSAPFGEKHFVMVAQTSH